MSEPQSWAPRQLILPCLLLLILGCGGAPAPRTVVIPHPALDQVDPETRAQIEEARDRLAAIDDRDSSRPQRAAAAGELGLLYQGYGFEDAALAAYTNAAAEAPDEFRWLYHLGALEIDSGNIEAGRAHLESALEISPDDTPTLLRLGRTALDRADYGQAEELYTRAAEIEPGCAAAHFGIGLATLAAQEPERAVRAFEQTLDLDPKASQTHRPLALAYRALDQSARAKEELALAGTAVPSCPDPLMAQMQSLMRGARALFERATLADLEGRTRTALDLAAQAVGADPGHAAARRLYGQLLTRAGNLDEAIEQLDAAAAIEPDDRRTYVLLGRAHRAAGDLDASIAALARAVELDPRYSRARIELALSQIEQGRWDEAGRCLEQGLELDPNDLDLRVQRARTLAAMGDLDQSRQELEAIVEQNDRLAVAHLALGSLLLDDDEQKAAEWHLEMALESEGTAETYAMAHYQLARVAVGRGFEAMAARHLESAATLAPSFVEAKVALGEVKLTQGHPAEAARLFSEAAKMRPDLPQARAGEALALLHSGRHLDARRRLEQANRQFPQDPDIAHLLARILATAPAPRVRDGKRALELSSGLFSNIKSIEYGETVAMALAELGRFDEAVEWQQLLLDQALQGADVEPEVLEELETRLADYRQGRPARDAW